MQYRVQPRWRGSRPEVDRLGGFINTPLLGKNTEVVPRPPVAGCVSRGGRSACSACLGDWREPAGNALEGRDVSGVVVGRLVMLWWASRARLMSPVASGWWWSGASMRAVVANRSASSQAEFPVSAAAASAAWRS